MTITTRPVEYKDGDLTCIGYLAWDESYADPKPCVLVNHAWGGLDTFAQDKAIQMAALGYVGFCVDNYGNGDQPESTEDKMEKMSPLKEDRAKLLKRLKAGYDAAAALNEVDEKAMAAIGFCFGGLCTLDMARAGLDLKAAISFHGLLDAPDLPKHKIKSKVLIAHGWDDPMAPPEDVVSIGKEMAEADCDWQLHAYGNTSHAFTVPSADNDELGLHYNPDSERRSIMAAQDLLAEVFGNHGVKPA